jgi:chromosome segregation ATPase
MDGPECPVQILILNKMAALWDRQLAPLEKSKRELEKENHQLKEKLRKHQAGDHTDTEELTREQANLAASAALQSEVSAVEKALNEALAREKEITSERDLLRNRVAELERANESLAEANRNLAEENQNLIAYRTTVLRATVSSTRRSDVISSVDGETTMASHPQSHRNSILRV